MASVRLESVNIGQVNGTAIYRVDLVQSGMANIGSITIFDDSVLSGGTGSHSGLDLDFAKLFVNIRTDDEAFVANAAGDPVLNTSTGGVVFQPGFRTPVTAGQPSSWNTNLLGTSPGNIYDPARSTLTLADRTDNFGALSLGEGGQITFLFGTPLSSVGRYFYYGDGGGNNEGGYVVVSDAGAVARTDFTLIGTSGKDTIKLGVGQNAHLKFVNTVVFGRSGDDVIAGASGNDSLYGQGGKDTLQGSSGNDWFFGGAGNDLMRGGSGADSFVFNSRPNARTNMDKIVDFDPRSDSIYLDNAIFTRVGSGTPTSPVELAREAFRNGSAARDSSDRIVYEKSSGALYYDRDGSGGAAQVQFAQLKAGLKMTFHDFFVI